MSARRGTGPSVLAFAVVSVALASVGHVLGHGHTLDLASLLVAVVLAAALGSVLANRWTALRLVLALGVVQAAVHALGAVGADPRLVTAASSGHSHAELVGTTGAGSRGAMLAWHLAAVPVAALLLAAARRSAGLVAMLARRRRFPRPVVVRALPPAGIPDLRPTLALSGPHLLVVRSNAPPCPA